MRTTMRLLAAAVAVVCGLTATAAEPAKKKLLFVTHSGGFIHDSVGVAEDVLKEVGPKYGYEVTCWRFTGDPDAKVTQGGKEMTALEQYAEKFRGRTGKPVEKENCGRINADTLKAFDAVLFFTTGNPLTTDELKDLTAWVKAGGAFTGTHCATDTLYNTPYGELIGGYFKTHPAIQKVKLKIEDPKHPAAVGIEDGQDWTDEYYIFRDAPYSRENLHIIMSIQADTFKPNPNGKRDDGDYAVSWCHKVGKGNVFYTSLGHRKEVWTDEKFQQHLFGGLDWAVGRKEGDASPSVKK